MMKYREILLPERRHFSRRSIAAPEGGRFRWWGRVGRAAGLLRFLMEGNGAKTRLFCRKGRRFAFRICAVCLARKARRVGVQPRTPGREESAPNAKLQSDPFLGLRRLEGAPTTWCAVERLIRLAIQLRVCRAAGCWSMRGFAARCWRGGMRGGRLFRVIAGMWVVPSVRLAVGASRSVCYQTELDWKQLGAFVGSRRGGRLRGIKIGLEELGFVWLRLAGLWSLLIPERFFLERPVLACGLAVKAANPLSSGPFVVCSPVLFPENVLGAVF